MIRIGDQYGYFTILDVGLTIKEKNYKRIVTAKCVCGKIKQVISSCLVEGTTVSCGCYHKSKQTKHGDGNYNQNDNSLYTLWSRIKRRCTNVKSANWQHYGGRGIKLFEEWEKSYPMFKEYVLSTIGQRPSRQHSLDRINNNGNYEPENIRWATPKQQANNRRKVTSYKEKWKIQLSMWDLLSEN